jgi:aspartokinase
VGESISDSRDVMTGFLQTIEDSGAEVIALASNSLSLCVAVDAAHKPLLAQKLHDRFLNSPL